MEKGTTKSYINDGGYSIADSSRNNLPDRKKVVILTPFYPPNKGGVETFCAELVRKAKWDYDIEVVTINWRKAKIWKGLPYFQAVKIALILFFKCLFLCTRFEYDTIHAQGLIAAFAGAWLKKLGGFKLLVTTHALYDFKYQPKPLRKLCRWTLNQADVIFTEGVLCKKELKNIGVKGRKIKMYQHWVNLDIFTPAKLKGLDATVLFAGRPIEEKGIDIIKSVEEDLKRENLKVRFEYATDVKAEDMPDYYRRADIVCVPSLYSESFARVVLEGCASGCAILASNKGSLPELVPITAGYVFQPTVSNFRNKIRYLICNKQLLEYLQDNAVKYAKENFSDKNAGVMLDEY